MFSTAMTHDLQGERILMMKQGWESYPKRASAMSVSEVIAHGRRKREAAA